MNIEIKILEAFPSLEKLSKDYKIFIQIKKEKYDLDNLIKSNKTITLKNIKKEIYLKLIVKDNIILGINKFNPNKFKDLFLIDKKPIYFWLDFIKEKNNPFIGFNSNFFLFENIRLKTEIKPILISSKNKNNLTYDEKDEKDEKEEKVEKLNYHKKKNINLKFDNSINNSNPNTSRNSCIKNKIFKIKNNKITLNFYDNTEKNISTFNNTSFTSKQNIGFDTVENNNNNKLISYKTKNNVIDFNKLIKEKKDIIKLEKKKLSLFGEQLLLNESDEVLNSNIENTNNISKGNISTLINNDIENKNEFKIETNQFNILKCDFDLFYSQIFNKNIKDHEIKFEFNLFINKSISILNSYNKEFSILFLENISLNNLINENRKKIKLLKKKISKLNILIDDYEFKIRDLELIKNSKLKFIDWIEKEKYFREKIFEKIYITNKNTKLSLANIIKKLINSKLDIFKNVNKNSYLLEEGKNKNETIDYNEDKINLIFSRDLNNNKINKKNLNKSEKSKIFTKTPNKEIKNNKKLKDNKSIKAYNSINNSNNKIFKTKTINIKKKQVKIITNLNRLNMKTSKKKY